MIFYVYFFCVSSSKQNSKDGVYSALWDKIDRDRSNNLVNSTKHGLSKVKRGYYAFIGDKTNLITEKGTDGSLTLLQEQFYPAHFGVALRKNSPYVRHFSYK